MATILGTSQKDLKKSSQLIREGKLVVFPTNNVYSIGTNAFNENAIKNIYKYKNKPFHDPPIINISNWKMGKVFCDLQPIETTIVEKLINEFWPGPLTLVVKANALNNITFTEPFQNLVALQSPKNKIFRTLISYSGLPIATSSANIFKSCSSTSFEHVKHYFGNNTDITIIKSDKPCKIGTETTIIKIVNNNISIVRNGIITKEQINKVLENELTTPIVFNIPKFSHYQINKYMSLVLFINNDILDKSSHKVDITKTLNYYLMNHIFIDFGGKNIDKIKKFYGYVDLSEKGDIKEALYNLYDVLHKIQKIDCKKVMIFNYCKNKDGLYRTLYDRLYRICNGKELLIPTCD